MIRLGGSLDCIPWEVWGSSTQTQPLGSPWKAPEPVRDRSEAKVITSVHPVNANDTNQRKSKPAASWVNCRGNVLKMTVWAFGQGNGHMSSTAQMKAEAAAILLLENQAMAMGKSLVQDPPHI